MMLTDIWRQRERNGDGMSSNPQVTEGGGGWWRPTAAIGDVVYEGLSKEGFFLSLGGFQMWLLTLTLFLDSNMRYLASPLYSFQFSCKKCKNSLFLFVIIKF